MGLLFALWGNQIYLSRMLHDILDDDHIQWHPPLIRHYTNFLPLIWTSLPNLNTEWTFYLIVQGSLESPMHRRPVCRSELVSKPLLRICQTRRDLCRKLFAWKGLNFYSIILFKTFIKGNAEMRTAKWSFTIKIIRRSVLPCTSSSYSLVFPDLLYPNIYEYPR